MTPPNPATTGPDIIEAAILNVVTQGEGYPVQLCAPTKHQHRSLLCTSRGKRPLAKDWAAMSKSTTMPDLGKWLDGGYNVGIVLDGDLVGLDEDVPGGLDVFFRAVGEPIPVTMGDIVRTTGKRHLIARLHPDFDPAPLRGTWYSPEGKSLGELVHHRNKQLVAPGCPWANSDGSLTGWREWNEVDVFATLSLAACQALVPPNGGFGFSSPSSPPYRGELGESSPRGDDDWQWDETLGSRHDLLRDHAREMRGATNDPVEISELTWQWGQKHGLTGVHPETQREVTYEEVMDLAFGAVHKFQPDLKLVVPRIERGEWQTPKPVVIPSSLFVNVLDYHAANSTTPEWVSPLAAYGTVSLVSGLPKSGKSTLISNLLAAREQGTRFLWGDPVPQGPMVLITEEGGFPVVRKTQGLTTLDVLDRMAFTVAGLRSLDHLLAALDAWIATQTGAALVVIDTLAVWGDIKDENDAAMATRAIVALRVWAQRSGAAVVLVHHSRKGGGEHGEAVRGSSGILAAVDQSIELIFTLDQQSDGRILTVAGRLAYGEFRVLAFNRTTMTYDVDHTAPPDEFEKFPMTGENKDGLTRDDIEGIWGVSTATANKRLNEAVRKGALVKEMKREPGERTARGVYWRTRPLLDLDPRSVSEKMASIFEQRSDDDDD
jgi:hypothetical protein